MKPGEIISTDGQIALNEGAPRTTLPVSNTGDRPVQVGSHYHFAETNPGLAFDRAAAQGMRLDIPAGSAIRFEPGQTRDVTLVPYGGTRRVMGFNGATMGEVGDAAPSARAPLASAKVAPAGSTCPSSGVCRAAMTPSRL